MKYLRVIFIILLIGVSLVYAEWPLPNEGNYPTTDKTVTSFLYAGTLLIEPTIFYMQISDGGYFNV